LPILVRHLHPPEGQSTLEVTDRNFEVLPSGVIFKHQAWRALAADWSR
jgi:hypothetical protein